jgi:hypothetical protein
VKSELGFKAMHQRVMEVTDTYTFREESEPPKMRALRPGNAIFRDENAKIT